MLLGILTSMAIFYEFWAVTHNKEYTDLCCTNWKDLATGAFTVEEKEAVLMKIAKFMMYFFLELFYWACIVMLAFAGSPHSWVAVALFIGALVKTKMRKHQVYNFLDDLLSMCALIYSFLVQIGIINAV